MGTITRNCPHCHSANSTFISFGEYSDPSKLHPRTYTVAFRCGGCNGGYIARVAVSAGITPCKIDSNLDASQGLTLFEEYPKAIATEAPKYLPTNIEMFYLQAADSLKARNHDASSVMSRKVLEVSVKKLKPDGSGSLYNRIEQLHGEGKITDDLKDWAHIIRNDGNNAAHEEEPVTPEFADELLSFAELFLMYTFTMPGMVNAKRTPEAESA